MASFILVHEGDSYGLRCGGFPPRRRLPARSSPLRSFTGSADGHCRPGQQVLRCVHVPVMGRATAATRPGPSAVTARLRTVLDRADWQLLADVLHPNVRWRLLDGTRTDCHGPHCVLSRCARLHALGLRVEVEETFTYPSAVVLGLRIRSVNRAAPEATVYQVFHLGDGLIIRITGYAERTEALDAAYPGTTVGL